MISWAASTQFLGGLGLFLLGMWLLTEGLKLAGGNALERILSSWTVTPARSFFSGFTLTAVVQSSSAVTVSVIGFINAGLLDLSRALWIVFGSNVGTSMTAWIVALIGFKFNIEVLALPAVGIGAILHLFAGNIRGRSLGGAMAGLGLLFLGLQNLQGAFANIDQVVDLSILSGGGLLNVLLMVLIGLFLTATMQSSSAALAVVLTAVSAGLLPLSAGAAAVIGANIGTTVTALIAVLKATANAKRVAMGHVLFNVITAIVALALLSPFLMLINWVQESLNLEPNPAISLALFHTSFNLLGVLLMLPLESRLTRWLSGLFTAREKVLSIPHHLDKNILSLPDLALNATLLDQQRLLSEMAPVLMKSDQEGLSLEEREKAIKALIASVNEYVVQCSQQPLPESIASSFHDVIRANIYLTNSLTALREAAALFQRLPALSEPQRKAVTALFESSNQLIEKSTVQQIDPTAAKQLKTALSDFKKNIRATRQFFVEELRRQQITPALLDAYLRQLNALYSMTKEYFKAARLIATLVKRETEQPEPDKQPL